MFSVFKLFRYIIMFVIIKRYAMEHETSHSMDMMFHAHSRKGFYQTCLYIFTTITFYILNSAFFLLL